MNSLFLSHRWWAAGLLCAGFVTSVVCAASPDERTGRSTRALEIARLRFKLYERVDYPLRQRQLHTEITLLEARVASMRRRVKDLDRFRGAEALFTTIEDARLALLEAELGLRDREHELTLLDLHNQDERRLRQLLIEEAAAR